MHRRAVSRLVSGEDASNFSASTDYDVLLEDGTRLAPKKVFGLALEDALGIEEFEFKSDLTGPDAQLMPSGRASGASVRRSRDGGSAACMAPVVVTRRGHPIHSGSMVCTLRKCSLFGEWFPFSEKMPDG